MIARQSWCLCRVALAASMQLGLNVVGAPAGFGTARRTRVSSESRSISSEVAKNSIRSLPELSLEIWIHLF